MYVIDHVYVSDDVIDEQFTCDLIHCQGACCVEGDLGAPLEVAETKLLDALFPKIKPFLSKEGLATIEAKGTFIRDEEGDFSTPTIGNQECAYAVYDKNNILKCGIEQAHKAGVIDFPKPISCHLYPIRVTKLAQEEALNYHKWYICEDACSLGKKLKMPIYVFLKGALIRSYGQAWYDKLSEAVERNDKANTH